MDFKLYIKHGTESQRRSALKEMMDILIEAGYDVKVVNHMNFTIEFNKKGEKKK